MKSRGLMAAFVLALAATMAGPRPAARSSAIDPSLYAGLRWRMVGPFRAGRVNAVTGVARTGQHVLLRLGRRRRVEDARTRSHVDPVFDGNPVASIGAIAVAPSSPDVVYVGTRRSRHARLDPVRQRHVQVQSTPAGRGRTSGSRRRGRSAGSSCIRATRTLVFVAALGHVYGRIPDRGVYRSKDGGATLAEGALQGRQRRGDRSSPSIRRIRRRSTRRSGPCAVRPGSSTRPRTAPGAALFKSTDGGYDVEAADERACRPTASAAWASPCSPANPSARLRDRRRERGRPLPIR